MSLVENKIGRPKKIKSDGWRKVILFLRDKKAAAFFVKFGFEIFVQTIDNKIIMVAISYPVFNLRKILFWLLPLDMLSVYDDLNQFLWFVWPP